MGGIVLEKLDDVFLKDVIGGVDYVDITAGLVCPLIFSSLGCSIASWVYFSKADRAKNVGHTLNYEKYITKAKNCGIATTVLLVASIIDAVTAASYGEQRIRKS